MGHAVTVACFDALPHGMGVPHNAADRVALARCRAQRQTTQAYAYPEEEQPRSILIYTSYTDLVCEQDSGRRVCSFETTLQRNLGRYR
jgi:hypothetical protein